MMVVVVLFDDLLIVKFLKVSVMIVVCSDEVCIIGVEGIVLNLFLVVSECGFEREWLWFIIWILGFYFFDFLDFCGMICVVCC